MRYLLLGILSVLGAQGPPPAKVDSGDRTIPLESPVKGVIETGFRTVGSAGNEDAYRSVVNLGEGPRLLDADLTIRVPDLKWLPEVTVKAAGWGGDPVATSRVEAYQPAWYRLTVDHRRVAYFNALPSYANPRREIPAFASGGIFNQRGFDLNRDNTEVQVDFRPGGTWVPFLNYTRDRGLGNGVTNFTADGNEYPIANRFDDRTHHFRGGIRYNTYRIHLLVEQGGTRFGDDQRTSTADRNLGNRLTSVLGQPLALESALQNWRTRGSSVYSRAVLTARLGASLDLSGYLLYSRPRTETEYREDGSGRFVGFLDFLAADRLQNTVASVAQLPHTSASFSAAYRPFRQLRILESVMVDRLEMNSAGSAAASLRTPYFASGAVGDRLRMEFQQQQVDLVLDVSPWMSLRGGHRYSWGESWTRAGLFDRGAGDEFGRGRLALHTGLGGISIRGGSKWSMNASAEFTGGANVYYRTSLQQAQKMSVMSRYQPASWLGLQVRVTYLDNQSPSGRGGYEFRQTAYGGAVQVTPFGGRRLSVVADYARTSMRSELGYFEPQFFTVAASRYRDNGHAGAATVDLQPWKRSSFRLSAGGAAFLSSGSRPTRYYQPLGRLTAPVGRGAAVVAEYRWYGMTEPFSAYESFRSTQFTAGIRFSPGS
jgi:hypothetical protein